MLADTGVEVIAKADVFPLVLVSLVVAENAVESFVPSDVPVKVGGFGSTVILVWK